MHTMSRSTTTHYSPPFPPPFVGVIPFPHHGPWPALDAMMVSRFCGFVGTGPSRNDNPLPDDESPKRPRSTMIANTASYTGGPGKSANEWTDVVADTVLCACSCPPTTRWWWWIHNLYPVVKHAIAKRTICHTRSCSPSSLLHRTGWQLDPNRLEWFPLFVVALVNFHPSIILIIIVIWFVGYFLQQQHLDPSSWPPLK